MKDKTDQNNNNRHNATLKLKVKKKKSGKYYICHGLLSQESIDRRYHSHKKRKDSLGTWAEPAVFSLQLEFRKFLVPSLREPA